MTESAPNSMRPITLPKYVELQPDTCHLQPFLCRNVQMYGFLLEGTQSCLQQVVDYRLNNPSGGKLNYQAVSPLVMLTFALVAQGSSTQLPDRDMGYIPETSCTFWLLLKRLKFVEPGERWEESYVFFPPFIIVDNCFSVTAGREIYGFPKQQGAFSVWPSLPGGAINPAPPLLSVAADALFSFNPISKATMWNMVEINRLDGPTQTGKPVGVSDIVSAWLGTTTQTGSGGIDVVFLKQFRDAADGTRACYQAIIEAPMGSSSSPSPTGWFLSDNYSISIADFQSSPWASLMGLKGFNLLTMPGTPLKVTPVPLLGASGFYAEYSFESGNGKVVWRAGYE